MLALLKWRSMASVQLPLILGKVVNVDGGEIVKFLQDTLDCLFDILTQNTSKYGEPVFDALVSDRLFNYYQ